MENDSYIILYQNHGSAIGYWEGWVEPKGTVFIRYAKKLDGKPVEKQYQAYAKNEGKANATTPYEQGVLELESKARLKIDKGYVRTIEEAKAPSTNSLGLLKPMLATPLEKVKPKDIDWYSACVQPKLDGHRALYKNGVLYSRQGKVLDLPHIVEAIESTNLKELHLDGELYLHGKTLQEISKLIKKHRPETLDLEYHVYDHISEKPFLKRVEGMVMRIDPTYFHMHPNIVPVKTILVTSEDEAIAHHENFRAQGYEGTMIRFGDEPYRDGKRSRTLLKLKEFQDEEFMILSVEEGKPYITDNGTFRVPVYTCQYRPDGPTFTVTAPGNMREKHALWEDRHNTPGKFLTVKFHYYSVDGIPQLPVALRFHETV